MFIRYGHEKLYFDVPETWNVLTLAEFAEHPALKGVEELVGCTLNKPVDAAPLKKQLSSSDKVAILIEDNTRNSPKKLILDVLLDHLESLSISPG